MIYFDNNATTPVDPEVSDSIFSTLKRDFGNPSSTHIFGRKAKSLIENAREVIADFLICDADEIYFTSGGTESNNLSLSGTALLHKKGHIITSVIEHPSVINTCRHLESLGFRVSYVTAHNDGTVNVNDIACAIRKDTILISVMHANNETGVVQPIEQIGQLAKKNGITFHVDAAQTIGKMGFSLRDMRADLVTIAAHKFYGPKGIGALFIRKGTTVRPVLFGAGHERGLRPGTENVAGIVGLGKACEIAKRDMPMRMLHTTGLRDSLLQELASAIPDMQLNGHKTLRLPNTLNICIAGISSVELVRMLEGEVALSSGSACHAGQQTPSNVLLSMGLSASEALSSVRLSVGKDNTQDDISSATSLISEAVQILRKGKLREIH